MLLSGRPVADLIINSLIEKISISKANRPPGLAVILVGSDPASQVYVRMKKKRSKACGMHVFDYHLPESTSESELIQLIKKHNSDPSTDGILVQLPLPKHISTEHTLDSISPSKDVDGLHPENMGKLLANRSDAIIPCTPRGIKALMQYYHIPLEGQNIVILGRSLIVGRPLSVLLSQNTAYGNATVTLAHSKTKNLDTVLKNADILIAAIGKPGFIKKEMLKLGVWIIDVGVNRIASSSEKGYALVGDVSLDAEELASGITPVPGGIGPMTISMLLLNTFERFCIHETSA